jgi:hypothetical protein
LAEGEALFLDFEDVGGGVVAGMIVEEFGGAKGEDEVAGLYVTAKDRS